MVRILLVLLLILNLLFNLFFSFGVLGMIGENPLSLLYFISILIIIGALIGLVKKQVWAAVLVIFLGAAEACYALFNMYFSSKFIEDGVKFRASTGLPPLKGLENYNPFANYIEVIPLVIYISLILLGSMVYREFSKTTVKTKK